MIDAGMLENLSLKRDSPIDILNIFSRAGLSVEVLKKSMGLTRTSNPYDRNVLASTDECEVMVAKWNPKVPCLPHRHGVSTGWVFFLIGNFREYSYEFNEGVLKQTEFRVYREGEASRVTPETVHSCESLDVEPGLTLHLYFPRIQKMQVFDFERCRTVTVSDDCGAWLPVEPVRLLSEVFW